MPTVRDVLTAVELLAPPQYGFSFDHIGLQIGDPNTIVTGITTTLDCTEEAIEFANSTGSNVIVAHHPVIWEPLKAVRSDDPKGALISLLVLSGISVIAAHTNWDCAPGGINDTLAIKLGLNNVIPFGSQSESPAYKLVTYVPPDSATEMIDALTFAGAGKIGLYERCAFFSNGTGTFRGMNGSNPVIGEPHKIQETAESRLEMVVPSTALDRVVSALRSCHPYEEPAYYVVPVKNSNGYPICRIGQLVESMAANHFVKYIDQCLDTKCTSWGNEHSKIKSVAVVGGAADGEWQAAIAAGADAYITGEIKHHVAIEASHEGLLMVQAGHFATEHPGMVAMADKLKSCFDTFGVQSFSPEPGFGGRPL